MFSRESIFHDPMDESILAAREANLIEAERIKEKQANDFLDKLKDFTYLPSRKEMINAFGPFVKKYTKSFAEIEPKGRFSEPYIDRKLHEIYGSHVYEVLTKEFIEQLANHIAATVQEIASKNGSKVRIVEIGAGNGRLSFFLKDALEKLCPDNFEITPVDNGLGKRKGEIVDNQIIEIKNLDVSEALAELNPDIVITSWMPKGEQWDNKYAVHPSVQEYILIGEPAITGGWGGVVDDEGGLIWDDEKNDQFIREGFNRENIRSLEDFEASMQHYSGSLRDTKEFLDESPWFKNGFTCQPLSKAHKYQLSLGGPLVSELLHQTHAGDKILSFKKV